MLMRYKSDHKSQTRKQIVTAARRVFANVGFDRATIDSVMSEAGLTRGGFYKHFPSKTALLIAAVKDGEVDPPERVECSVKDILRRYVDEAHLEDKGEACPLFTFPSDVSRHGTDVKQAYEDVASSITEVLGKALPDNDEDTALALMAMCVGCMVVINSSSSESFKRRLRSATLKQIARFCGD